MEKIIITSNFGFGNKIFNVMIGLYIKYLFGGKLYMYVAVSPHEKLTDPKIYDMFPKLLDFCTFMDKKSIVKVYSPTDKEINVTDLKDIDSLLDLIGKNKNIFITVIE